MVDLATLDTDPLCIEIYLNYICSIVLVYLAFWVCFSGGNAECLPSDHTRLVFDFMHHYLFASLSGD